MYPYFLMLAFPAGLALLRIRGTRLWLLLVGLLYFVMMGFRFRVGMDWNNYIDLYQQKEGWSLAKFLSSPEPGFGLLTWISVRLGWKIIFTNVVAAAIFCWGFFSVAKRCREPWLAVTIATPLLVIAFAMSGIRQAIAAGILFHLIAHWEARGTLARLLIVALASTFHFSAIFLMIFVALGSNASRFVRLAGVAVVVLLLIGVAYFAPASIEAYSRLYLGAGGKLTAPGAVFQILPIAAAALLYFSAGDEWTRVNGDTLLQRGMAWAALMLLPIIPFSSVGAYRFGLYLWPMAMTVYSGYAGTIESGVGRGFYRICIVAASFALLIGWLLLGNNSYGWIPYQNWLTQPDGAVLWRYHYRQ